MGGFDARIAVEEFRSSVGYGILVAGLVGDIFVLVVPGHRQRLEKLLTAFFTIVIIIGVAVEHRADNAISLLVSQEQTATALEVSDAQVVASAANVQAAALGKEAEKERLKRVEIEERMAWRRLTEKQQGEIAAQLKNFPGETGGVWFNASDIEGDTFASDIAAALRAAHWKVVGPASFVDFVEPSTNPPPLPTGLTVASTGDVPSLKASSVLVREFKRFGFDCTKSPKTESRPIPMVFVNVESRPDTPQGGAKLRQRRTMASHQHPRGPG